MMSNMLTSNHHLNRSAIPQMARVSSLIAVDMKVYIRTRQ